GAVVDSEILNGLYKGTVTLADGYTRSGSVSVSQNTTNFVVTGLGVGADFVGGSLFPYNNGVFQGTGPGGATFVGSINGTHLSLEVSGLTSDYGDIFDDQDQPHHKYPTLHFEVDKVT